MTENKEKNASNRIGLWDFIQRFRSIVIFQFLKQGFWTWWSQPRFGLRSYYEWVTTQELAWWFYNIQYMLVFI